MRHSIRVRTLNFFRNIFKIAFLEKFLASLTQNKLPDSLVSKFVPNPYQYAPGSIRTIHRNGLTVEVDISDYIGHYLYFGFLDAGVARLFALCQKGFNIIDVGTNIGWVALNFAKIAGTGKVIGFEPDPFNYAVCKTNSDQNALPNLTILPIGLGETSAEVMMEVRTPGNRGGNRIALNDGSGSVSVKIKRLDGIDEITRLHSVNLIKLDVEGYELKVLRGAIKTIQKHKPILFIEVDDDNLKDQGDSAKDLISLLEKNGYNSIVHAETNEKITSSWTFAHCHFDIIAR